MTKVYESPDGGHTVYSRENGSTKRTLETKDDWAKRQEERIIWSLIYEEKDRNPALKKAVENVIVLYRLIDEQKN